MQKGSEMMKHAEFHNADCDLQKWLWLSHLLGPKYHKKVNLPPGKIKCPLGAMSCVLQHPRSAVTFEELDLTIYISASL